MTGGAAISQRPSLYSAAFHDTTAGTNDVAGVGGFSTETNWDAVTGLGTPKASALLPLIASLTLPSDGTSDGGGG